MGKLISNILYLLNITVVLALVAVKLGTLISPNTLILLAYPSLALLPIVLLNVLFVCYWLLRRKWKFLYSLIALLLCNSTVQTVYTLPFGQKKITHTDSYHKITLLSYNTMDVASRQKHTPQQPNPVIQYLYDTNADILCLQEFGYAHSSNFFSKTDMQRLFKSYPYQHLSLHEKKWGMTLGVATFSKYPIIKREKVDYPVKVNQSIYSDIVIGDDTIRVVNNHLESNRITQKEIAETQQLKNDPNSEKIGTLTKQLSHKLKIAYQVRAKQADAVAKLIAKSPYRVVACGDFNDVPSSYAYTKIKGKLKDAFVLSGKGMGITFAQSLYRFRIDYIFHDAEIKTDNFKVGTLQASDHYPIQTDLYLKKKDTLK